MMTSCALSSLPLGLKTRARTHARGRASTHSARSAAFVTCRASSNKYHDDVEITPMMLTTSALGAFGTGLAVFALATSVDATMMATMRIVGVEIEEMVEMEYSTGFAAKHAPAVAIAADVEDDEERLSGQELFDCEIQSFRCTV